MLYDLPSAYENSISEPGLLNRTYGRVERISLEGVTELGRQGAFSAQGDFSRFFDLI